ncbi:MAG: DUF362 domain-containing protein [Isosphaeraceae bacterium]
MSSQNVKVAVVRGETRRSAVSEALAALSEDLRARIPAGADVLVKPNLVSHKSQLPSTHVEALSATLDGVFSAGAGSVLVAEGATDATAGFERFGFRREASQLPVRFLDLNRDEDAWEPIELVGVHGERRIARVSRTVASARFRVSLALAKTHVTSIVTLSLKNMLSSLHPDDRVMMHGFSGGGNGYQGWKRLVVEFLKGDDPSVRALTRFMGLAARFRNSMKDLSLRGADPFEALAPKERAFLQSVEAMNRNLVALTRKVRPHLGIVDGFLGMHGEGPRHGTPFPLKTVIAGFDPVAVDAVASAIMGFNPDEIGYLHQAQAAGLGICSLDAIEVVGEPIARVRRVCRPHSNHRIQRHWRRLSDPSPRGPHLPHRATTSQGAEAGVP